MLKALVMILALGHVSQGRVSHFETYEWDDAIVMVEYHEQAKKIGGASTWEEWSIRFYRRNLFGAQNIDEMRLPGNPQILDTEKGYRMYLHEYGSWGKIEIHNVKRLWWKKKIVTHKPEDF